MNVRRTASFVIYGVIALQIAALVFICLVATFAIDEIRDNGLKSVIERIWEGPSNASNSKEQP